MPLLAELFMLFKALQAEGKLHAVGLEQGFVAQNVLRSAVGGDFAAREQEHAVAGVEDHVQIVLGDQLRLRQGVDRADDGAAVDGV